MISWLSVFYDEQDMRHFCERPPSQCDTVLCGKTVSLTMQNGPKNKVNWNFNKSQFLLIKWCQKFTYMWFLPERNHFLNYQKYFYGYYFVILYTFIFYKTRSRFKSRQCRWSSSVTLSVSQQTESVRNICIPLILRCRPKFLATT